MKKLTKQQVAALNAIRQSKGRFFGLYTTQGDVMNARFVNETDEYINVYDRNRHTDRKLAKSSIQSVTLG
jgi:hypothetical protein